MIHAELHPPAGPADEPVPRRGAREEGRLPSPPPPDSPCDDKPSPSASDGGIGNSSVTAAVWLRMLAGMPSPQMLVTVNTHLQTEIIKQQRKTNALLRARTQTLSASLAPARTRTRLVQQQQHHALRWQPSEERDPADHRAQPGEVKYEETG